MAMAMTVFSSTRGPLHQAAVSWGSRLQRWFAVWPTVAFLAIFSVGAVFRFANLGLVRHSYDYAYPIYDALRILDGRMRPLLGQPSSVFLDNPPLMGYLEALPLLFWRSPWAVYLVITALNTLAIWFVYRVARQLLGEAVGLAAAFLFAINPWVVFFSRTTWLPALLPFFMAVIAWGLWPVLVNGGCSPRRVLVALTAMAAMMESYIQAWGVLAQVGLLVELFRRRIPRQAVYAGGAILGGVLILYGLGLAHSPQRARADLDKFLSGGQVRLSRTALDHAVRLVSGWDFDYVYTRELAGDYPFRRRASLTAHYLLALALLAGLVRAAVALCRPGRERCIGAVLLLWFLVPVLLMSVTSHPVHPYYLLLTCPAGHILAAWGIVLVGRSPWLRSALALGLLTVALLFGLNLERAAQQVAARPTEPDFAGWALEAGAHLGATVRDLASEGSRPVRIAANGHEALLSSLSGIYITTLREIDFPSYIVLPGREPLLYVLINRRGQGPVAPLGPRQAIFPGRDMVLADGTRVSFVQVRPYGRQAALALPAVPLDWRSEAGLSFLGYTVKSSVHPGQVLTCATYWRVEELLPERWGWYIGAFYHLLDRNGRMVANLSGHGQWASRWQAEDIYVERVRISLPADLPPGEYWLEVGLFDTIHGRNYSLLSPDGPLYALRVPIQVG